MGDDASSSDMERSATCGNCGGDVLLEVHFGADPAESRIYAECDGCGRGGRLSWAGDPL